MSTVQVSVIWLGLACWHRHGQQFKKTKLRNHIFFGGFLSADFWQKIKTIAIKAKLNSRSQHLRIKSNIHSMGAVRKLGRNTS